MKSLSRTLLTSLVFFPLFASAQNDGDYRSAATGSWNVVGTWERYNGGTMNWEPAVAAPTAADGAIAIRDPHTVTVNTTVTADQITVESGGTLIAAGTFYLVDGVGDDLIVNGTFNMQSGVLGSTGTIRIAMGGLFSFTTASQKSIFDPVTNDGTIQWQEGDIITYANSSASIINNSTITISGIGFIQDNGGTGSFTNNGTITKASSGNTSITNFAFSNPGTINVPSGSLSLIGSGSFTNTGTITLTSSNLTNSTTFNHNTGSVIQGTGSFTNTGTLNLNIDLLFPSGLSFAITEVTSIIQGSGNLTINNDISIRGILQGTGTLTVNGNTSWISGTLDRTFTNQVNRTFTVNSTFQVYLEAPIVNEGTMVWQDGTIVSYVNEGASFTNNSVFNINNNNLFQDNGGVGSITNNGTINKTNAGLTTFNNYHFSNPGTFNVQAGTLALGGSGSFTNTSMITLTTANLTTAVSFNHNTGSMIQGTGSFTNTGTLNLNIDLIFLAGLSFASNGVGSIIQGAGNLTMNNDFTIEGTIQGAGTLTINGNTTWPSGTLDRTFTIQSGRTLTLNSTFQVYLEAPLINNGTIAWQDGNLVLYANEGSSFTNHGTFNINANKLFQDNGGVGTAINHGIITKTSAGLTNINNLTFTNSATGEIQGVGTFAFSGPPFTNNGIIAPGLSPGIITITGSNPLSANSTLGIEVNGNGGPGVSNGHDKLIYNNNLTLNGTLTVVETGSTLQDTFSVLQLTSGTLTGDFINTNLPQFYSYQITSNEVLVMKITSTLMCPADTMVNTSTGQCQAIVNGIDADVDPPGEEYIYVLSGATTGNGTGSASGLSFNVGVTTVTYKLSVDTLINCSFTVTIQDNEIPSINCPSNITVNTDAGQCNAIVNYTIDFSDNCPGVILSQTEGIASGDTFPVGMTTNTFEVIDDNGNSSTCSFTITVQDNELPVITCPSDIAADTGEVVTYTITFDDNCPGAMLTQTAGLPSGSEFPVGETTNSFEVTDGAVNVASCNFLVIVTVEEGGGGNDTLPIGRVGINTTEPMAMLHVRDSSVLFNGSVNYSFPGSPPPASGSGTRMMWYPSRGAFRVGRTWSSEWNQNNLGPSSFASGESTKAIGYASSAMGYFTTASGLASFAIGSNNVASGQNTVAMGAGSTATNAGSLAAGYSCNATGLYSIALGVGNAASGNASLATGGSTMALGNNSSSFGYSSRAKGPYSFAAGVSTRTNGWASFAVGVYNDTIVGVQTAQTEDTPLFTVGNGNTTARKNAMVVRYDGKTGIGTSTPERRLHVRNGVSGATSNSAAVGVFENSGNVAINLLAPDANSSGVFFGNTQNTAHGGIHYNSTTPFGLAFRTNGNNTKMVITNTGSTGIGTIDPARKLEVSGNDYQAIRVSSTNAQRAALELKRSGSGHDWRIIDSTGLLFIGQSLNDFSTVNEVVRMGGGSMTPAIDNQITLGNSTLRWTSVWSVNGAIQTSDENDKASIEAIPSGLSKVMALHPVSYHWKNARIDQQKTHLGFIAQDLLKVAPEAVMTHDWKETPDGGQPEWTETDKLGVNYSELIPLLTKAIQEQQDLITQQQETINMLLQRIETIEARTGDAKGASALKYQQKID